jgi:lipopolysaccharide exporter
MSIDKSTSSKMITGGYISVSARLFVNILGIISTIILARILSPEDYGVVGMVVAVGYLLDLFADIGIGSYLISKTKITNSDLDKTWTANFFIFIFLGIIFVLISEPLAKFYNNPEVLPIFYIYSLNFLIRSFYNVTVNLKDKELDFVPYFKLQVFPKITSILTTIPLAMIFESYWALVTGMLLYQLTRTIMSYVIRPYKPNIKITGLENLFRFSIWIFLNNILRYINGKSIEIIIGKIGGSAQLGLFNMANDISNMPFDSIINPLNRSLFSGFSRIKQNMTLLTDMILKSFEIILLISLPMSIGLFIITPVLVPIMLGEKWLEIIEPLQILALAQFFKSVNLNITQIFIAQSKPKIPVIINFITIPFFLAISFYFYKTHGLLQGVSYGYLFSNIFMLFISIKVLGQNFSSHFAKSFVINFFAPLFGGFIMYICYLLIDISSEPDIFNLLSTFSIGVITYSLAILFYCIFDYKKKLLIEKILENIIKNIKLGLVNITKNN